MCVPDENQGFQKLVERGPFHVADDELGVVTCRGRVFRWGRASHGEARRLADDLNLAWAVGCQVGEKAESMRQEKRERDAAKVKYVAAEAERNMQQGFMCGVMSIAGKAGFAVSFEKHGYGVTVVVRPDGSDSWVRVGGDSPSNAWERVKGIMCECCPAWMVPLRDAFAWSPDRAGA